MALVYLSSRVCATGRALIFNLASLQWSSSFGLFVWDGVYLLLFLNHLSLLPELFQPPPLVTWGYSFPFFFFLWLNQNIKWYNHTVQYKNSLIGYWNNVYFPWHFTDGFKHDLFPPESVGSVYSTTYFNLLQLTFFLHSIRWRWWCCHPGRFVKLTG